MRIVSADWVVPVESAPIQHGAVAIADDGTIAAVGPASELGQGEHHEGCVILPGFVNAHSHLEYAVYAGFGDGLPFVPWIGLHVQRKDALDFADMTAIATVGAFESLRSGITTTGDCSFSGAAALAAASTGLRALVYLEVFSSDVAPLDRFHESRGRIEHVLSERIRLGVSPHAPYTCTVDDYRACAALGLPQATHFAESAAEREWLVAGRAIGVHSHGFSWRRRERPASGSWPRRASSGPGSWLRIASTPTPRRSSFSRVPGSAWRTVRGRTAISAAASPRWQS